VLVLAAAVTSLAYRRKSIVLSFYWCIPDAIWTFLDWTDLDRIL